ncbi:MAG: hypothetical protein ACOCYT_04365 [Chloroflexota bacterium]
MSITWNSLYLWCEDTEQIADRIRQILTDKGYTLYDPFGMMPGRAYPQTVRLFVMPPQAGWSRVVGLCTPDGRVETVLLPALSSVGLTLAVSLDETQSQITVAADGAEADPVAGLEAHLRAGCTADDLRAALAISGEAATRQRTGDVPVDLLPDDIRAMANKVNSRQVEKFFNKIMRQLGRSMGDKQQAARDMLNNGHADWSAPAGQRVFALIACLTMPDDWRTPDFVTLRDAYQLHLRRQQRPDAMLYPGDAEAMAAFPDALHCVPVYGGKLD